MMPVNSRALAIFFLLLTTTVHGWFPASWAFEHLCWSPDGRHLCIDAHASVTGDGTAEHGEDFILTVPASSSEHWRPLLPSTNDIFPSNSGDKLALAGHAGLFSLDLITGAISHLFSPFAPHCYYDRASIDDLSWSKDDRQIALSTYDGGPMTPNLYIVNIAARTVKQPLSEDQLALCRRIHSLKWHDADVLLLRCGDHDMSSESTFCRLTVSSGRIQPVSPAEYHGSRVPRPTVRIARDTVATTNITEYVSGFATQRTRHVSDTLLDYVIVVDFPDQPDRSFRPSIAGLTAIENGDVSPDGRLVYFEWSRSGTDSPVMNIADLYTIDGAPFRGIWTGTLPIWLEGGNRFLSLSRDGYVLTGTDGRGRFVRVNGQLQTAALAFDSAHFVFEALTDFGPLVGVAHIDSPGFHEARNLRHPLWLAGGTRLLYRAGTGYVLLTDDGAVVSSVPFIDYGHAPVWIADSVILFRAGHRLYEESETNSVWLSSPHAPLWCLNPHSGTMAPAQLGLTDAYHNLQTPAGDTVLSPDGCYIARLEQRMETSRLWVSPATEMVPRLILDAWANYSGRLREQDNQDESNQLHFFLQAPLALLTLTLVI